MAGHSCLTFDLSALAFRSVMNMPALATKPESTALSVFAPLANRTGSVWLDSSMQFRNRGQWSFIATDPQLDVRLENDRVVVTGRDRHTNTYPPGLIWNLLGELWDEKRYFSIGYISYEATLPFLGLCSYRDDPIPPVRFLFYDTVQRVDHSADKPPDFQSDDLLDEEKEYGPPPYDQPPECEWRIVTAPKDYLAHVRAIKQYIREGDIYQANYTTRIDGHSECPPFDVYRRLRRLNPAPYSAFLNFGDYQVLSSSPERMFRLQGSRICTGPIKGTIAAGRNHSETQQNRLVLRHSEKNKAELLMIVDLERNDLGRIASPGTVKVERLFGTETYSSVIHLVSDISAELRPDISLVEILSAMLPGGSITGAPKRRAVEIINRLESVPRSVYTGCIGYVHGDQADFNIAIRTMIHSGGRYRIHAGGGIVADSEPEEEYDEMLLKARNLLRAVGVTRELSPC